MMMDQCKRTNDNLRKLIGENWESLIGRIPRSILVRVPPESSNNPTGQMIAVFTLNLLIRLFPMVTDIFLECPQNKTITGNIPHWQGGTLLSKIDSISASLPKPPNLLINSRSDKNELCCHITIGSGKNLDIPGIWVGSNRWIAIVSSTGPQKLCPDANPVGAYAAATLAVSETWKRLLLPLQDKIKSIRIYPLDGVMKFSTFDYSLNKVSENPILPKEVDINRLTMIGLGAGGGAAAYTLLSMTGLTGTVTLIDPDEIESSNLNRYVYADQYDARKKKKKVHLIEQLFDKHTDLKLRALPEPFMTAKKRLETRDYKQVLAAVDNRITRRNIQYETPEVILDGAATEKGDFFIWRMVLGRTECMFCKHPEDERDADRIQAKQMSMVFGLTPRFWQNIIGNNDSFSKQEIDTITVRSYNSNHEIVLPKIGQRFNDWFKKNCGRFELPEIDGEIPIPFAPVMTGILQAGEIIKGNFLPKSVLQGYYWNTLTAKFSTHIKPQIRKPSKQCSFCRDEDFVQQYNRRWGR